MSARLHSRRLIKSLEDFLQSGEEQLWSITNEVFLDGPWEDFLGAFESSRADLLAAHVRNFADDPKWWRWRSLSFQRAALADSPRVAALLPVARFSRAAAEACLRGIAAGWNGHIEVVIPTMIARANLTIEDIGGGGAFTPGERRGRWYDSRSFQSKPPIQYVPGKLHHPVEMPAAPLSGARYDSSSPASPLKLLLALTSVEDLPSGLSPLLERFTATGMTVLPMDRLLGSRTGAKRPRPGDRYKWQMAAHCLTDTIVAGHDYIFCWDRDIFTQGFDPVEFAAIMRSNYLDLAQPGVIAAPEAAAAIALRQALPPPPHRDQRGQPRIVAGRLTNFVEAKAPVFSRAAWLEFMAYLRTDSRVGSRLGYLPLGRKGIVDAMPVMYATPPLGSRVPTAKPEDFASVQGLFRYKPQNYGWIYGSDGALRGT